MQKNKFYVTTPIYYVTAPPHIGSLYSTLLADVAARYGELLGADSFFLTGTDEHGQKIAQAAEKAGKSPKQFVDGFVDSYKEIWKLYNINYSRFIRTTDTDHVEGIQKWIQKLIDKGDIYKDKYSGFYCTPCETFVTEKDHDKDDKIVKCVSCGRETQEIKEECYFFKLSAYQDRLLKFFKESPDFISPKERLNEVVSFVKSGLKDLSISRKTVKWGIPFPGDDSHVTYVWADALNNYLTGIGYGTDDKKFKELWPADLQILGKDIVRFHAIYWPAFLMASDLELPKKLLVHGWIKINDQKMSKSLGNAIDPEKLAVDYGIDTIRYYLVRKMAITQDSEFSFKDIQQSNNSELANDLGNLLNRCSMLAAKNDSLNLSQPSDWSDKSLHLKKECQAMIDEALRFVEDGYFYRAVNRIWELINKVNAYFHEREPWKLAKSDKKSFKETIAATVYSLQAIGIMLWPVMPETMEKLIDSIGSDLLKQDTPIQSLKDQLWTGEINIKKIDTLFKKIETLEGQPVEKKDTVKEIKKEEKVEESFLKFEDFLKVDMRVGTIKECEAIEGSDKLLKMQVDLGELGNRQILAGLKKYYQPEDLIGKQGVFVVNLKPRKIMGVLSEGMMLATNDKDRVGRIIPDGFILEGSRVG